MAVDRFQWVEQGFDRVSPRFYRVLLVFFVPFDAVLVGVNGREDRPTALRAADLVEATKKEPEKKKTTTWNPEKVKSKKEKKKESRDRPPIRSGTMTVIRTE